MNIGQRINTLFERSGYKNYADWGKAMNLSGDWLLDMKKKDIIKTVDITRLITIAEYNHISLDWLLSDSDNSFVDIQTELPDNDIGVMFNQIQKQLQEDEVRFNGFPMNDDCKEIAFDSIDILKGLIKSNL